MADTSRTQHETSPFELGELGVTRGAVDAAVGAGVRLVDLLLRHMSCDWGDLDNHDQAANVHALAAGERLLSNYPLGNGMDIWIITEADRSATTILLPAEY
jgi:hypothetical protein